MSQVPHRGRPWRPARGAVATALLLVAGCAGSRHGRVRPGDELTWPAARSRILLERIIESRSDLGSHSRSLLSWLAGRTGDPLFARPYGVAWDGDALVVVDPDARRVVRIGPDDALTSSRDGSFEEPVGVAACADGVLVTDARAGRVVALDRAMRASRVVAEGLDRPTGVAFVGGVAFVIETGQHRVLVIDRQGARRSFGTRGARLGEFNFPTVIAAAGDTVFVGDTLNFRVQRFAADSLEFRGTFGALGDAAGEMPRLKGLAVDRAGHVWVSDAHLNVLALYSEDGKFLMDLGREGPGPGEFSFPAGIAAHPDGRVAVVDALNRRIQIFRVVDAGEEVK